MSKETASKIGNNPFVWQAEKTISVESIIGKIIEKLKEQNVGKKLL